MRIVYRTILVAVSFLILVARGPVAGQQMTAAEGAVAKAEAQRHVERYYNYYYERDPESLSTEIFTTKNVCVLNAGAVIVNKVVRCDVEN